MAWTTPACALNPRLNIAPSPASRTGPYCQAVRLHLQGMGGLMAITGIPTSRRQPVGLIVSDLVAGMYASVAILAALEHRDVVSA